MCGGIYIHVQFSVVLLLSVRFMNSQLSHIREGCVYVCMCMCVLSLDV